MIYIFLEKIVDIWGNKRIIFNIRKTNLADLPAYRGERGKYGRISNHQHNHISKQEVSKGIEQHPKVYAYSWKVGMGICKISCRYYG